MHVSVRQLMQLARWATPTLAVACALQAGLSDAAPDRSLRFLAGAGLAAMAFAALPRSRRSELLMAVAAYSTGLLLLDHLRDKAWHLDALMTCCAGAAAIFACSCLEKLRWLARSEPDADVGQVYPTRRRSAARRVSTLLPPRAMSPRPSHRAATAQSG